MAGEYRQYPLIEAAIRSTRLPRLWTITIVAGGLLLLLILSMFLDDELDSLFQWNTVSPHFLNIVFLTYILVVYRFMLQAREKAILAFKPLLALEDDAFNKVVENTLKPSRRGEWTAVFLGIGILGAVLFQPWTLEWAPTYFWVTIHYVTVTTFGMGLMGWLVYDTLVGIIRIYRLSRQDLKLDILNPGIMAPVANWSLGISLVFVGIFILSIISDVTQTTKTELWKDIIGYAFLIGVTLLIFFLSMWGVHRVMSDAKKSKLIPARKLLAEISRELEDREAKDQREGMIELSSTFTAWTTYETRVKEAPTWPFNASIIRRLIASIIFPAVVYLIKILAGLGIRF
ncbi:MAG: hypothetical protein JSU79_00520 [Dehalococcoidales bacterium]|nr:MAG: hypothetical protein JSU79_00520 [Dehalococcoidales bacterium]